MINNVTFLNASHKINIVLLAGRSGTEEAVALNRLPWTHQGCSLGIFVNPKVPLRVSDVLAYCAVSQRLTCLHLCHMLTFRVGHKF